MVINLTKIPVNPKENKWKPSLHWHPSLTLLRRYNRELKHARFWEADGNRKWAVFPFNLPSHNHIHIAKYLFSIRDK